jgi:hypothetical protein
MMMMMMMIMMCVCVCVCVSSIKSCIDIVRNAELLDSQTVKINDNTRLPAPLVISAASCGTPPSTLTRHHLPTASPARSKAAPG